MDLFFRVLVENRTDNLYLHAEHGLSLFIESKPGNILFDTGGSSLFARNAEAIGLELFGTDAIVISHGHIDHGSGLRKAMTEASRAILYIHKDAVLEHLKISDGVRKDIGIPETILGYLGREDIAERTKWVKNEHVIWQGTSVFSCGGIQNIPRNWKFFEGDAKNLKPDRFRHEISLLVSGRHSACVVSGCCHHGFVKIIERASRLSPRPIKYFVGGTHMGASTDAEITELCDYAREKEISIYTGHCTGIESYAKMHGLIPGLLKPLSTGLEFGISL